MESTSKKNISRIQIWGGNIILAALCSFFVVMNVHSLQINFKLSVLLMLLFNIYIVILAFVRRSPKEVTQSYFDYTIAFCGTCAPLLFLGIAEASDHILLLILQVGGILFSFAGLLSLNRSFGIVPANRGIVTTGMYRFVRHPLYTGYVISFFSFMLQNFSTRNLAAFIIFMTFELLRLILEENFLSQNNKEYAEYMKKVKWRVLPYIW
jgi:protein-S-isoprenylcysteine O-methyltransferase Ste14